MKILHITNDYSGSSVYKNLIQELDQSNVGQVVFTPVKEENKIGVNRLELNVLGSEVIYSHILNKHVDRIFYKHKINKIYSKLTNRLSVESFDIIHAHTWFSDGGVAYLAKKRYNIPYIITIRNSDINVFFKYLLHHRQFAKKILLEAEEIVLISSVYKSRILEHPGLRDIRSEISDKLNIIPNGVDVFWINNIFPKREISSRINIIYVGKFTKGKNVIDLIEATEKLSHIYEIKLHLVGFGGSEWRKVKQKIEKYVDLIEYHGKIKDKKTLLKLYRNSHIFAMPSKAETFGLVYVEALLQGLPILYTENEGIDGLYNNDIGEKVSVSNQIEIYNKLKTLIDKYNSYNFNQSSISNNHNWKLIANTYKIMYTEILSKRIGY